MCFRMLWSFLYWRWELPPDSKKAWNLSVTVHTLDFSRYFHPQVKKHTYQIDWRLWVTLRCECECMAGLCVGPVSDCPGCPHLSSFDLWRQPPIPIIAEQDQVSKYNRWMHKYDPGRTNWTISGSHNNISSTTAAVLLISYQFMFRKWIDTWHFYLLRPALKLMKFEGLEILQSNMC